MSNATCASPIASSQLFFAWSEHTAAPQPTACAATPASVSVATAHREAATGRMDFAQQDSAQMDSAQMDSAQPGRLSFTREARIAKPVRMGAVMIKLLKRYGITDQEIAEGVANYARKHQKALAS